MGNAARRLSYRSVGMSPRTMIDINSEIATGRHSLSPDPGEAVGELRDRAKRYSNDRNAEVGAAATSVENVVRAMIDNMVETGEVHPGLLAFYAAKGVPTDTLERLASGGLPMDDASRAARAREMGLDPDMVWTRHDIPMLDHARLNHRGGLTYAGFTPYLADQAAVSKGQAYPLIAPPEIVGLQQFDALNNGFFGLLDDDDRANLRRVANDSRERADSGLSHNWSDGSQSRSAAEAINRGQNLAAKMQLLNQRAVEGARDTLVEQAKGAMTSTGARYGWASPWSSAAPGWKELESKRFPDNPISTSEEYASQMIQDRARRAGAKGTLVADEGGASVAFMTPEELRHADLSILDPAYKGEPGYMRSMLPVAGAAAGSRQQQQQQSPLKGISE